MKSQHLALLLAISCLLSATLSPLLQAQHGPGPASLPEAPTAHSGSWSSSSFQTTSRPDTPAQSTSESAQESQQQRSEESLKEEEKQRMLGIMPAFNAVENGKAEPLTPREKFQLWYKSALDPFTFATAGIDAGIEQAQNSYPEYHQGFVGFAKRYGASYADNVDGNFWGNAVLPVLLKEDPRYFRLGHGSFKRRLGYSLISVVRCKGDDGRWKPSYGNVLGNLIGGAISNAYYPASDRGVGLTLERGFTVTAEGSIGALAYEFYPDAIAYLKRHHKGKPATAPTTTPATPPAATP